MQSFEMELGGRKLTIEPASWQNRPTALPLFVMVIRWCWLRLPHPLNPAKAWISSR